MPSPRRHAPAHDYQSAALPNLPVLDQGGGAAARRRARPASAALCLPARAAGGPGSIRNPTTSQYARPAVRAAFCAISAHASGGGLRLRDDPGHRASTGTVAGWAGLAIPPAIDPGQAQRASPRDSRSFVQRGAPP